MSSAHVRPRRRLASPTIDDVSESLRTVSLRKGSTFHSSSKNESDFVNPFFKSLNPPSMPSRSATCPKTLEELLIGAGERRVVELLERVDDAITKGTKLSSILSEPEVLPVPRFMVEHASISDNSMTGKDCFSTQADHDHHRSDSGIGSSIVDSVSTKLQGLDSANAVSATTAITKSISGNSADNAHGLSEYSQVQIHEHIIKPILGEESLKDFHLLVKDIPKKIGAKEITTLRDLEKTLIFLAPDFSRTPALYRSFCETSIRCLHLTVDGVHESDQCLPTDRPYSPGYFIDLVEQIRRYASILAASREKQERGEQLDEMDAKTTDRIELQGGVSHNGKPAFLTRTTEAGQHISMADGHTLSSDDVASSSVKRPMEDTFTDDDGVRRSMARRKKNEPIRTYHCSDAGCDKHFKRPCDLTKHAKTHMRPYKCPHEGCAFFSKGWPTEKERDRHFNDKHSSSPNMYKCLWEGCPYTSKRESNCKQHMEKNHGWDYVRSKNNGKGKAAIKLPTASSSSPNSSIAGPSFTPVGPSPLSTSSNEMIANTHNFASPANYAQFDFGAEFDGHFNTTFLDPNPITPAWSDNRYASDGTSSTPYSAMEQPMQAFDEALKMEDMSAIMFDGGSHQQPTPVSTSWADVSGPSSSSFPNSTVPSGTFARMDEISPHISPNAQDLTLTSHQFHDNMLVDEGFNDAFEPDQDFQLFAFPGSTAEPLFPDQARLDNMGSQFNANTNGDSQMGNFNVLDLFPELTNGQKGVGSDF